MNRYDFVKKFKIEGAVSTMSRQEVEHMLDIMNGIGITFWFKDSPNNREQFIAQAVLDYGFSWDSSLTYDEDQDLVIQNTYLLQLTYNPSGYTPSESYETIIKFAEEIRKYKRYEERHTKK